MNFIKKSIFLSTLILLTVSSSTLAQEEVSDCQNLISAFTSDDSTNKFANLAEIFRGKTNAHIIIATKQAIKNRYDTEDNKNTENYALEMNKAANLLKVEPTSLAEILNKLNSPDLSKDMISTYQSIQEDCVNIIKDAKQKIKLNKKSNFTFNLLKDDFKANSSEETEGVTLAPLETSGSKDCGKNPFGRKDAESFLSCNDFNEAIVDTSNSLEAMMSSFNYPTTSQETLKILSNNSQKNTCSSCMTKKANVLVGLLPKNKRLSSFKDLKDLQLKKLTDNIRKNKIAKAFERITPVKELFHTVKAWEPADKKSRLHKQIDCFENSKFKDEVNKCASGKSRKERKEMTSTFFKHMSKILSKNDSSIDSMKDLKEIFIKENFNDKEQRCKDQTLSTTDSFIRAQASLQKASKVPELVANLILLANKDYISSNKKPLPNQLPLDNLIDRAMSHLYADPDEESQFKKLFNIGNTSEITHSLDSLSPVFDSLKKSASLKLIRTQIRDKETGFNDQNASIRVFLKKILKEASRDNPNIHSMLYTPGRDIYEEKDFSRIVSTFNENNKELNKNRSKDFYNFQIPFCADFIKEMAQIACAADDINKMATKAEIINSTKEMANSQLGKKNLTPKDSLKSMSLIANACESGGAETTSEFIKDINSFPSPRFSNPVERVRSQKSAQPHSSPAERFAKNSSCVDIENYNKQFDCSVNMTKDSKSCKNINYAELIAKTNSIQEIDNKESKEFASKAIKSIKVAEIEIIQINPEEDSWSNPKQISDCGDMTEKPNWKCLKALESKVFESFFFGDGKTENWTQADKDKLAAHYDKLIGAGGGGIVTDEVLVTTKSTKRNKQKMILPPVLLAQKPVTFADTITRQDDPPKLMPRSIDLDEKISTTSPIKEVKHTNDVIRPEEHLTVPSSQKNVGDLTASTTLPPSVQSVNYNKPIPPVTNFYNARVASNPPSLIPETGRLKKNETYKKDGIVASTFNNSELAKKEVELTNKELKLTNKELEIANKILKAQREKNTYQKNKNEYLSKKILPHSENFSNNSKNDVVPKTENRSSGVINKFNMPSAEKLISDPTPTFRSQGTTAFKPETSKKKGLRSGSKDKGRSIASVGNTKNSEDTSILLNINNLSQEIINNNNEIINSLSAGGTRKVTTKVKSDGYTYVRFSEAGKQPQEYRLKNKKDLEKIISEQNINKNEFLKNFLVNIEKQKVENFKGAKALRSPANSKAQTLKNTPTKSLLNDLNKYLKNTFN